SLNMANYKTPPNRRFVRESRPHDFLYDPIYTMPSRQDFLKDAEFGMRSGARIKLRPVDDSMFSALKTDRRIIPCMTMMRPNNLDNFVPQYDINGVPIIPADTGPLPTPRQVDDVTGADRAKYATRYTVQQYKLETPRFDFNRLAPEDQKKLLQNERTRRVATLTGLCKQIITDPYSPPYFLPYPGAYPKLLALVKLTWEKGLPFSLDDIVIIERALSKRILEHVDRDIETENQKDFERRIKLMEELEAQQWADREKELDKVCQRKMELTSRLLQEYSARVSNDHTMRLEKLLHQLKQQTQKSFQTIKHQYFRDLRKLEKKYIIKKESRQRDIIKDYTDFGSSVYAPLTRNGAGVDMLNKPPPFAIDIHHDFASTTTI
ncbi:Protein MAATS1, partial [Orchesella cincta]